MQDIFLVPLKTITPLYGSHPWDWFWYPLVGLSSGEQQMAVGGNVSSKSGYLSAYHLWGYHRLITDWIQEHSFWYSVVWTQFMIVFHVIAPLSVSWEPGVLKDSCFCQLQSIAVILWVFYTLALSCNFFPLLSSSKLQNFHVPSVSCRNPVWYLHYNWK